MNKIEINIGLNNNPFTNEEIIRGLNSYFEGSEIKTQVQTGEWDGGDEPTLVVELFSKVGRVELREFVVFFTMALTQDAIPFRFNGRGELVFHKNYKGERYPFDEAYFLTIKG